MAGPGVAEAAAAGAKSAPETQRTAKAAAKKKQAAAKKRQAANARRLLRTALADAVAIRQSAKFLGVSASELRRELNGSTLTQVAEAHDRSAAGLQAAIAAAFKKTLDQAVAKKRITQAQANKSLAQYRKHVAKLMTKVWSAPANGVIAAVAAYLGLTPEELREQLPGTSLAALAEERGKLVEGLKAAMAAAVKARLDKAVASMIVTAKGAKVLLARFQDRVDGLVAKEWPAFEREAQDDESLADDESSPDDDSSYEDDGGSLEDEDVAADEDSQDDGSLDEDEAAAADE